MDVFRFIKSRRSLILILLSIVILFLPYVPVNALAGEREAEFRANDILFYDGGDYQCAPNVTVRVPDGSVYVVGDSIANGSRTEFTDKFNSPWSITNEYINAEDGRHVGSAVNAINADFSLVSNAVAIVVELGTNDASGNLNQEIQKTIEAIRSHNASSPIFWVDVAVTTFDPSPGNNSIYDLSDNLGYDVIPWFNAVFTGANPTNASSVVGGSSEYLEDGVHPNEEGRKLLVDTVFESISNYGVSLSASNIENVPGDNVATTFKYLIEKGFSNEQAAGVVGNFVDESGVNPQNVQNSFTKRTGIEDGEHDPTTLQYVSDSGEIKQGGYGIAQWTTVDRKQRFKEFADATNRLYGSLETQLDLFWYELTGEPSLPGVMRGGNAKTAYDMLLAAQTVEDATLAFLEHYEISRALIEAKEAGGNLSEIFADRIGYAQDAYDKYAGRFGSGGTGCGETNTSSLVNTIVSYVWPFSVPRNSYLEIPPKQAYIDAAAAAASRGEYVGGYQGIDCGAFVTRVMRDSGFDTNYNSYQSSTPAQKQYLDENWQKIEIQSTADLQPGDVAIFIYPPGYSETAKGHTFMYIGEIPDFETNVASAALGSRSPASGRENPMDPDYTWYRRI